MRTHPTRGLARRVALLLFAAVCLATPTFAQGTYVNFESPQVHPAAFTPDGTKLLVTNTADARLTVFDLALPSNPCNLEGDPGRPRAGVGARPHQR